MRAVILDFKGNILRAACPEHGKYRTALPSMEREGSPPDLIGFNGRNLSALLSPFGSAIVRLDCTDKAGPMLVTSEESALVCVIMPMRVD